MSDEPLIIPIQDGRGLQQKQNGLGIAEAGDPSYTLTATGGASIAVAFDEYNFTTHEKHQTLRAGTPQSTGVLQPVAFEPGAMSRIEGHDPAEISPTLRAQMGDNQVAVFYEDEPTPTGNLTPWPEMGQPNMVYRTDTVTRTVDNNRHNILTTTPIVKAIYENQRAEVREGDIANALATGGGKPGQGYPAVRIEGGEESILAFSSGQSARAYGLAIDENIAPPLRACGGNNSMPTISYEPTQDTAGTLTREGFRCDLNKADNGHLAMDAETAVRSVVRRLTPMECERLQGFPDNHTLLRADGKVQADTHRYKQMGNAVAVPVVEWVIAGIVEVNARGKG